MRKKLNLLTAIFLLLSFVGKAQETTSEIQGTITDNSSGPLTGATITALHQPTGTKYATTSRKDGRYNLPNLRIGGPYEIKVSFVGFNEGKQENITLLLGQEYKADFKLTANAATLSEVVVSGARQDKVFNNNRTGSQETISRTQIERLPTISRSIQDFTKLEPTANGLNIGGRSSQYNNITVDGANFNNSFGLAGTLGGQTSSEPISLEAIEQIQVSVAPYDVTQGGFSGTGINTVTKSGTNQFKGSAYAILKGPGTQGYKVGTATLTKTDFSYHTLGFSVGGPIVKDKLFFFLSAEQVRQTAPATSIVASDATHSPGGSIAQANFDTLTALRNFLNTTYGYDPGEFQNYTFKTNSDKVTAKIDWNINSNNTLTVKYNYLKSSADQFASTSRPGQGQVTGGQPGTISLPFYGSGYVINNNFNIVIAELNTRFGNKASNKLQVGYTALRDFRSPHSTSPSFPLVDILNGSGNIYTTFGYEMYTYNNILNTDVFQFADIFKFYKGSHEITVGTQDYYRKYQNAFAPGYQGVYQFNSLTDFYNSVNNKTANAKSYYLQYSALPGGEFPFAYAGSTELGLFAQDKWRASKNFTLTYGLRADLTIYKQSFTDNPYFDALVFKDGSYNIGKAPKTTPLFSPRLGFNWDINGDRSIQVRGGAGVFAGPPPFVWISNQASNNGIQFGSFTNTSGVVFNPNPTTYIPTGGAPNTSYSTALVDRNFKYPQVLKSSLAVDKKLPKDYILTLEATYSKDINAVYYQNINLNETNGYALAGADNRIRYNTSTTATNNNSNKYYSGTTLANPNIGNAILMSNTSKGYSYTITGRVQKTYRNLFASIAYTYSQSKNTAEFGSTASSLWSARAVTSDPNGDNLANAAYYQPNRIIAYASYKFITGKYASTSIGAIFEATQSGVSSYVYNGDLNGDGNTGNDLIYIPRNVNEIKLVRVNSGGLGTGTSSVTDTRSGTIGTGAAATASSSQIWNQLNNFINQDHYLSAHRGEYAEANAVISPFYKRLDLNITEDLSIKTGKERHTLRLTLDLINAGNFFNKYWGTYKTPNLTNFLKFEGLGADGKTPSFSMPYLDANNQVPLVNSFRDNSNILSRWQMQFGIRYLFN
ncbi:MAG: TonB-dependent receptor plug [Ferruginibacter sp.]|nr:TonB-dependent receptor plug [Ferruginibacter sp.]